MKKKLQILWWQLNGSKKFRVHLCDDNDEWIGFTALMRYSDAVRMVFLSGGQIVCEHAAVIQPDKTVKEDK